MSAFEMALFGLCVLALVDLWLFSLYWRGRRRRQAVHVALRREAAPAGDAAGSPGQGGVDEPPAATQATDSTRTTVWEIDWPA